MPNDFYTSYNNWKTNLTGTPVDPADTELMSQVISMDNAISNDNGDGIWDTLNLDPSIHWLWSDDSQWQTVSANITDMLKKVRTMAIQEATTASAFYHNQQLQSAIVYALDWINTHCYSEIIPQEYDNWWDWEIGSPEALNDTLCLAKGYIPLPLFNNSLAAINYFVPDPTVRTSSGILETGANLLDKCFVVALAAVLSQDSSRVHLGLDSAGSAYEYVTQGDGYYLDGSFIQHTNVPYTGGYGEVLLSRTCDIFILFKNTDWLSLLANVDNVYEFIPKTYAPTIYSDIDFDMTRGRGISRETSPAHSVARSLLYDIYFISGTNTDIRYQKTWAEFVKSAICSDKFYSDYYSGLSITKIQALRNLLNDSDIPANPDSRDQNIMMAGMCQMVHQKGTFACGVSMFSDTITAFECGNGENKQGWYTGTGMFYLYNSASNQFDENYWPTVDMLRLPGITTDRQEGTLTEWHLYPNEAPQNWSGGVSTGTIGHASMIYTLHGVTGSSLSAIKSWFLLDKYIVILAAGISSSDSNPVETIIDNRQIDLDCNPYFQVDGYQVSPATTKQFSSASWAHLNDEVNKAPIGYVFLTSCNLLAENVTRTGAWSTINDGQSSETVSGQYATLSVFHGTKPYNDSIVYALLPQYSAEETRNFQLSPPVRIICNDVTCQAIATQDNKIWGGNFFEAGQQENIQALTRGAILLSYSDSRVTLAFSDPTRKLASVRFIINNFSASQLIEQSPQITFSLNTQTQTLSVDVDTSAYNGSSSLLIMS